MKRILTSLAFVLMYALNVSGQYATVTNLAGTATYGGINVTVTSAGSASATPWCGVNPYWIGGYPGGPGSYTYTFSAPVKAIRVFVTAMDVGYGTLDTEKVSIFINGVFYPLTAANITTYAGACGQPTEPAIGGQMVCTIDMGMGGGGQIDIAQCGITSCQVWTNGVLNGNCQTFQFDTTAGGACGCTCDMKIAENRSTTYNSSGVIEGSFYINSGSKKVVSMEMSVPYWNYDFEASGCKFDCSTLTTGFSLGNIIKTSDVNGYYPTFLGCFGTDFSREVDWAFPSPQYINQGLKYIITIPPTDCRMDYYYCVKVLLHYDDCSTCECTFCFKGDEIICSCEPSGEKMTKKTGKPAGISAETTEIIPNPNGGKFTVQMEKTSGSKVITVMDMTGKTVSRSVVSGSSATLELNNVNSGTYNVIITGDGKTVTKRVVITK